jgi:hypothetical protein
MQEIWYALLGELWRSGWEQRWRHALGLQHLYLQSLGSDARNHKQCKNFCIDSTGGQGRQGQEAGAEAGPWLMSSQ